MTEPGKAVFLSYASEDSDAAGRICEALRVAGVEVWLDKSELRSGDAWNQKIQRQIRQCELFVPIISANTQARLEGYFRLEWKIACDRSQQMAAERPFFVPVVIDDTQEADAHVPEPFRAVQWTMLPAGVTTSSFCERVIALLSGGREPPRAQVHAERAAQAAVRRRPSRWIVIGAVTVLLAAAAALLPTLLERFGPKTEATAPVTAPATAPEKSIAVLPFADMSPAKDQAYFSDGLAEELLDMLSLVPDLKVPARTSSFYFRDKQAAIREIGNALHVSHVLEGSVRKEGRAIRVTVRLVRTDNGYHVWSETYDRNLKDVFKVQDEIAAAVVQALKARMLTGGAAAERRETTNTEAYNQYLLANQFFNQSSADAYRRAVATYRQAIALDPGFAAAYAGLAAAEIYSADYAETAAQVEANQRRALAAADKAISLAPALADGYAVRGWMRSNFVWDWDGARSDFERALALNPADSTVQRRYGQLLGSLGRLAEAVTILRKVTEVDPLSAPSWGNLGFYLTASGQLPEAREALDRALTISPGNSIARFNLGLATLLQGQATEALAIFRQAGDLFGRVGVALAEFSLGHAKESQRALDELIATGAQSGAAQIADVYAWRGEPDRAFEWLERAYVQRDGGLSDIQIDVMLKSLHGDPRYAAFLRKMNFPRT